MKRTSHLLCLALAVCLSLPGFAQSLGVFEKSGDLGPATRPGTAAYSPKSETYELSSTGSGPEDSHFAWKRMRGDFILTARAEFVGRGVGERQRMGWMVRSSLEPGAPFASATVQGDGAAALQFRRQAGSAPEVKASKATGADVIQLERKGNVFALWVARFGEPFTLDFVQNIPLGEEVYAGLFVGGQTGSDPAKARFRDVRLTVPAPAGLVPYKQYLASNLEVLDVKTGGREIVYTDPGSIQAPNWTPDGKTLLYNREGLIYTFDLKTRKPKVLDTGNVDKNNNDHVLSFDGSLLGLSSTGPDPNLGSLIYTVPITGGQPKLITPVGPSYLHGWSPDGRFLVFTGSRNNEFDIYRVTANGGPELRLTDAKGLDDGPEYSPDGQYIYFNSNRTGNMLIYRMKADGTEQTALTDGPFHDWFPHVSPDGKWLIFLSFLREEVKSGDHPFYKHVYLRMMPVSGGKPKVVAYLYGGQGTLNTPSWSPDSKHVAFVSNTAEGMLVVTQK